MYGSMDDYISWYELTEYLVTAFPPSQKLLPEDYKYIANRAFHYWLMHQASLTLGVCSPKIGELIRNLFELSTDEAELWLKRLMNYSYCRTIS